MKFERQLFSTALFSFFLLFLIAPFASAQDDAGTGEFEGESDSHADGGAEIISPELEPIQDEPAPTEVVTQPKEEPEKKTLPQINFKGTETLISEYIGDNGTVNEDIYGDDDDFWIFRNILYFQANNKHFDSAIRLDLNLFANPPSRIDFEDFDWGEGSGGYTTLNYDNDFRVERIHGTAHIGNLHLTAGDSYVSFGRGIALSLIKLDDVGVDNALRGGRVEYNIPRKFKIAVVGGVVNTLNLDTITKQVLEDDPLDRIVGARAEWEIKDALSLGVHGVFMRPRYTEESEIDPSRINVDRGTGIGVITGGASLALNIGGAALYLEGDGQSHDNYRPVGDGADVLNESGYAAFGEFSYDLSPFLVKAEGLLYKRWLMEGPYRSSSPKLREQPIVYNHLVTLEPQWMIIKSMGNAQGGRLTGDLFLKKTDTQLTLTFTAINYEGGLQPDNGTWEDSPALILHPILKARQRFEETDIALSLEGGYRHELDIADEAEADSGHLWHVLGDLTIPINGPHSIELKGELRRHELQITEGEDHHYWVTMESIGYERSGMFGITLVHEYSNETKGGDTKKIGGWTFPLPQRNYMWALISYHPPAPLDDLTLRFFAGSQRGGIKCAGGVCRVYPDAVGVKLEAVYRF